MSPLTPIKDNHNLTVLGRTCKKLPVLLHLSQKENTSASYPQIINRFCEATYVCLILSFAQTNADTLSPPATLSGSLFPATSFLILEIVYHKL
jgi:hypothetical protein